jgi:two-component system, cell cycle sensor histidine kinase and response regulator CckA
MVRGTQRILIVDDEPALLRMMSVYLERLGFEVTAAGTTGAAWMEVENAPSEFDIAVLDATMSGLSMQDLALRILQHGHSVRVIAASGYPVDMSAMEAEAPGRVMFLHKPFTPEMLAAAVRRMLGSEKEDV